MMQQTPAAELLLAVARRFAGIESPEGMRLCTSRVTDWRAAMDLARAHGMEPLAAYYINTDCAGMFAPEFHKRLRAILVGNTAKFVVLSTDLIKVLRILEGRGIPVVPLKGPVLAEKLFSEIPWRDSCDLDLLIPRIDIGRAKDALVDAGYRLDCELRSGEENAAFHWTSQLILYPDGIGPALDLHWELLPSLFPCARYFDSVWQRLQHSAFDDLEILALSAEDQLFFLCAHAARHSWHGLRHAVDIARLIHVSPNLDWDSIIHAARGSDGVKVLALGLWMVNRLLEVDLPETALRFANAEIDGRQFASRLLERMVITDPEQYETSSELRLQLQLANGWWPKLRCAAGYVLLPTAAEGVLRLPASLFFLYYLYRPIRLTAKYGMKFFRMISGEITRTHAPTDGLITGKG
ncbi:nucleotidyltransferase domain-containing protein [Candidatus Binatus sp.]|uniref:nucleotidyltransferase domain-containing protein n=1 Tax=Candidatus Binatus sp. TaxID=2811406 RepID=UPI003CAEFDB9